MTTTDLATTPLRIVGSSRRVDIAAATAVLCLATVLLEASAGLLPADPVVWVLTPLRLVLAVGIGALLVAGLAPRPQPLDLAVGLVVLAAAVATVAAGQDWSGWRGVLTSAAAYLLATGVFRTVPRAWPAVALLLLVGVAVAGAEAVKQAANAIPTGFCRGAADASADVCGPDAMIRAVGTFGNPNLLAAFLVLVLPVAAAGAALLTDRHARLLGTAVVVVGYATVLLTGSRGGIVAALAGAAAFVVLHRPTRLRLLLVCGTAAAAVVALLALGGGTVGVRADVWGAAIRLAIAHPFGVGPGRAGPLIAEAVAGAEEFQHAHDLWLNWAVETGALGLLGVLAGTVLAAVAAVRAARTGSRPAAAAGAGLAGFAVMSLTDHPANALRVSVALAVVLGLAAARQLDTAAVRSRSGSR